MVTTTQFLRFYSRHIPGLGNIADFLSRHPMAALKEDVDETEDYINSMVHYSLPKHVSEQKIQQTIKNTY